MFIEDFLDSIKIGHQRVVFGIECLDARDKIFKIVIEELFVCIRAGVYCDLMPYGAVGQIKSADIEYTSREANCMQDIGESFDKIADSIATLLYHVPVDYLYQNVLYNIVLDDAKSTINAFLFTDRMSIDKLLLLE